MLFCKYFFIQHIIPVFSVNLAGLDNSVFNGNFIGVSHHQPGLFTSEKEISVLPDLQVRVPENFFHGFNFAGKKVIHKVEKWIFADKTIFARNNPTTSPLGGNTSPVTSFLFFAKGGRLSIYR